MKSPPNLAYRNENYFNKKWALTQLVMIISWRLDPTLTGISSKTWSDSNDITWHGNPPKINGWNLKNTHLKRKIIFHPPSICGFKISSFFRVYCNHHHPNRTLQLNMDWHSDINQTFPHDFRSLPWVSLTDSDIAEANETPTASPWIVWRAFGFLEFFWGCQDDKGPFFWLTWIL